MRSEFRLDIAARAGKTYVPFLRTHLIRAHRLIPSAPSELSLALVGDVTMSRLHEQYMHISGPTDVLSFLIDVMPSGRVRSGEVIVCVPEAQRQAKRHRIPVRHELLLYALHGLLHLSGFDDRTNAEFTKMHRQEDTLLKKLGIGPVFAREPGVPGS